MKISVFRLLNILIYFATAVSLILFTYLIQDKIVRKWADSKLSIDLMKIAVGSALVLAGIIEAMSDGLLPVSTYFIILAILSGILIYYGIIHRKEVSQRMKKSYYSNLAGLSYSLLSTGVIMFWFAPFFPNVVL